MASPHAAIGTAAVAVAVNAAASLGLHARGGKIRWPCAIVFSLAGIAGALVGAALGKAIDGQKLLAAFGLLMVLVGAMMLRPKPAAGHPSPWLSRQTAAHLLPRLAGLGAGVGLLSGVFGIGGGFLIVPGLMLATGMPILNAVGSSLVAVAVFGLTTAGNYAVSGLVDWRLAAMFLAGGVLGGLIGAALAKSLAVKRGALNVTFAFVIFAVAAYMLVRSVGVV
jgi:uncharacterized membrane protein YfcA